ncbi:MAG TPA: hypothetical protein VIM30_08960 [Candidatus Limnocylindrales bacterium]|jgi:hypothetical protein
MNRNIATTSILDEAIAYLGQPDAAESGEWAGSVLAREIEGVAALARARMIRSSTLDEFLDSIGMVGEMAAAEPALPLPAEVIAEIDAPVPARDPEQDRRTFESVLTAFRHKAAQAVAARTAKSASVVPPPRQANSPWPVEAVTSETLPVAVSVVLGVLMAGAAFLLADLLSSGALLSGFVTAATHDRTLAVLAATLGTLVGFRS